MYLRDEKSDNRPCLCLCLHHFLEHAVTSRPLMLLLDGHSLQYTLELVKLAAQHDVVIFCLIVSRLILHASSHLNLIG